MNAGVTSITALMAKSDLDGDAYVQEHGEEAYVELVAAYSLFIGIASLFLQLGSVLTAKRDIDQVNAVVAFC